jgi:hypothetical protein
VGAAPGQDLVFDDFRSALGNLLPGADYQVTGLALSASAACDSRTQNTDLGTGVDIHIRSVEIATMIPINETAVEVTVITPVV